jgi:hypothetical protein
VTTCSWMNIHYCEYLFIYCTGQPRCVKYKCREERLFSGDYARTLQYDTRDGFRESREAISSKN